MSLRQLILLGCIAGISGPVPSLSGWAGPLGSQVGQRVAVSFHSKAAEGISSAHLWAQEAQTGERHRK